LGYAELMNARFLRGARRIGYALLVLTILLVVLFRRPVLFELPADCKGWVIVRLEDPGCPPLGTRSVFRVVSVPNSGKVCTSSREILNRPAYVRFEYVHADGKRTSLPWATGGGDTWAKVWLMGYDIEDREEEIFVGDVQEMNNSGPRPHYGTPPPKK
jgi:hypothetical protein